MKKLSDELTKGLTQIVSNLNKQRTYTEKIKGIEYILMNKRDKYHGEDKASYTLACRNYEGRDHTQHLAYINFDGLPNPKFSNMGFISPDKNLQQLREYLHAFSHAYNVTINEFAEWFSEVNPHSIENYSDKKQ